MKIYKQLLVAFVLIGVGVLNTCAQENEGLYLLKKLADNYTGTDTYQMSLTYNMYRGYAKDSLTESYSGSITKVKESTKMSFLKYDTYVFPDVKITLSKEPQLMLLNDPDMVSDFAMTAEHIEVLSKTCEIQVISKTKKEVKLSLIPLINFSSPYAKYEILINSFNYSLKSQTLFLNKKMPFTQKNNQVSFDNACMEIIVDSYNPNHKELLPTQSSFIKVLSNGTYVPNSTYESYEFIDQRTK